MLDTVLHAGQGDASHEEYHQHQVREGGRDVHHLQAGTRQLRRGYKCAGREGRQAGRALLHL